MATKAEYVAMLADATGLTKQSVRYFLGHQLNIIADLLNRDGASPVFDGLSLKAVRVPKKPARKGRHPFTGEWTTFKAKPAHTKIKASIKKALKDVVK